MTKEKGAASAPTETAHQEDISMPIPISSDRVSQNCGPVKRGCSRSPYIFTAKSNYCSIPIGIYTERRKNAHKGTV